MGGGGGKKRKDRDGLPGAIDMAPASDGGAPFAVYFPSGFNPNAQGAECAWETHAHSQRKNQYAVVAKTVRNDHWDNSRCHASQEAVFCALRRCRHCVPPPLPPPLQEHTVDFVGSSANAEYSSALPCRSVHHAPLSTAPPPSSRSHSPTAVILWLTRRKNHGCNTHLEGTGSPCAHNAQAAIQTSTHSNH